jgi:hypothetical protein
MPEVATPITPIPTVGGVKPQGGGGGYNDISVNAGMLGGKQTAANVGITGSTMGWAGSAGLTQGVGSAALAGSAANMALIQAFSNATVSGYAPVIGPNPLVMQSTFSHGWRENS